MIDELEYYNQAADINGSFQLTSKLLFMWEFFNS